MDAFYAEEDWRKVLGKYAEGCRQEMRSAIQAADRVREAPLSDVPAAPRSADLPGREEIAMEAFIAKSLHNPLGPHDDYDQAVIDWRKGRYPDDRELAFAIADAILALLQAPRPGETGDGWSPNFDYDNRATWPPNGHALAHLFHNARLWGGWQADYFEKVARFFYPNVSYHPPVRSKAESN